MFNVQQMSSSVVRTCAVAPASFIAARVRASLLSTVSPVYFCSSSNTGSSERIGRSSHTSSIRSYAYTTFPFFSDAIFSYSSPSVTETTRPSNPTFSPSARAVSKYSPIFGTPGCPIFISSTVVPSSCFAAWIKYLPSVHRRASVFETTAVPADPVNPVIYSLALKCSPTYSL